mmetsp:Transcript_18296/g.38224  ORF Transcript_18296/g.38224 Transcript_18296/m.38224 type:complete len:491 (-) Transcript_18296:1620-3092(-)
MASGFFRGTALEQDSRFRDKNKKLMQTTSFNKVFDEKVDVRKVDLSKVTTWIERRITELLGFEDEVVINFTVSQLEEERYPDGCRMQVNLTGFLEERTASFMEELWKLLLDMQGKEDKERHPSGIREAPKENYCGTPHTGHPNSIVVDRQEQFGNNVSAKLQTCQGPSPEPQSKSMSHPRNADSSDVCGRNDSSRDAIDNRTRQGSTPDGTLRQHEQSYAEMGPAIRRSSEIENRSDRPSYNPRVTSTTRKGNESRRGGQVPHCRESLEGRDIPDIYGTRRNSDELRRPRDDSQGRSRREDRADHFRGDERRRWGLTKHGRIEEESEDRRLRYSGETSPPQKFRTRSRVACDRKRRYESESTEMEGDDKPDRERLSRNPVRTGAQHERSASHDDRRRTSSPLQRSAGLEGSMQDGEATVVESPSPFDDDRYTVVLEDVGESVAEGNPSLEAGQSRHRLLILNQLAQVDEEKRRRLQRLRQLAEAARACRG